MTEKVQFNNMLWDVKKLTPEEADICRRTLSPKAAFALVGHAVARREGLSVVRMGDGEVRILEARDDLRFSSFDHYPDWNVRLGIEGLSVKEIQRRIIRAANECTYFAPSVSGISMHHYRLHDKVARRDVYFDNFFVNDWTKRMIRLLLEASDGVFIAHREYREIIDNFVSHYELPREHFAGIKKESWQDNERTVSAALASGKQLILFSAGPAGKVIGPELSARGLVSLDIGNTLPHWSVGDPSGNQ